MRWLQICVTVTCCQGMVAAQVVVLGMLLLREEQQMDKLTKFRQQQLSNSYDLSLYRIRDIINYILANASAARGCSLFLSG